ncbi:GtrA family protein [Cupriavidus gilardii]|uniref:GtrA family protein n=1 Tax=Cupriavidus gilardii TaxID=82541 RepID=UPI0015812FE2|nr:GtrA family protein [Cupriavidus gilardii]MCT9072571.1 GtrA family protein [Cupriavidus gilardii]QKS63852.1 GtrA family protein [Cupriavidus gilardii]
MPGSATLQRLVKYTIIGAAGTAAHYVVLIGLIESSLLASPVVASSVGAVVGALINYFLNYRFTFQATSSHRSTLPKFLLIAGAGVVLNGVVMAILTHLTSWLYIVNQLIATAVTLLFTFAVNSAWTFKEKRHG